MTDICFQIFSNKTQNNGMRKCVWLKKKYKNTSGTDWYYDILAI